MGWKYLVSIFSSINCKREKHDSPCLMDQNISNIRFSQKQRQFKSLRLCCVPFWRNSSHSLTKKLKNRIVKMMTSVIMLSDGRDSLKAGVWSLCTVTAEINPRDHRVTGSPGTAVCHDVMRDYHHAPDHAGAGSKSLSLRDSRYQCVIRCQFKTSAKYRN